MELLLTRHLWGITESWETSFPRIRARGYSAIEAPLPALSERSRFRALLDQYQFDYIAQIFTAGSTVAEHLQSFREQVDAATKLHPLLINSHSGRDAWSETESIQFFDEALAYEAGAGTPVAHETHRGRILYNPWITSRLLDRFRHLQLCCDFSHWVCVCERLLDEEAIIRQCAEQCIHIHARVGYEEGPQVPDPRAPEYHRHLAAHERWWQMIWDAQQARGMEYTTLTPEFGPPGYMQTLPYNNVPVADLQAICDWQATRQAEQFARRRMFQQSLVYPV